MRLAKSRKISYNITMKNIELNESMNFTARNDYAFKKIFGTEENKDILTEFICLITKMNEADFEELTIENTELPLKFFDDKASRLDIKITLKNGQKIDIEMQNLWFDYYAKRTIYYWTELFTENFKRGDDYWKLNKCIAINILNQPFKLSEKMHSVYHILEKESHTVLDDVLEIHFLDLTKLPEKKRNKLENWLLFIQTDKQEVRDMLSENDAYLQKANDTMNDFYASEQERAMYKAACRYESDRVSMINESMRKGIQQTAINMRKENCDPEFIARMTGLSIEEIKRL